MMANHRSLRGRPTSTSTPVILSALAGSIAAMVLLLAIVLVYCWRKRQWKDGGMLRRQRTTESVAPDDEASVTSENSKSLGVDTLERDHDSLQQHNRRWPQRWSRRRPPKRLLMVAASASPDSEKPSKRRKRQSPSGKGTGNCERERSTDTTAAPSICNPTKLPPKDGSWAPEEPSARAHSNDEDNGSGIVRSSNWEKSRKMIALVIHAQQHPESYA